MKTKAITDIDTALRIYYQYPEIGNSQIRELFGVTNGRTLARYKRAVQEEQMNRNVKTSQLHTVNTEVAYDVWGIDVVGLEKRREKLKKLGLSA
jgi:hypothetical protein